MVGGSGLPPTDPAAFGLGNHGDYSFLLMKDQ